jgi:large subunit ribosomal protein L4
MSVTETITARTGTVLSDTKKKERPAPVTRTAPHRNAAGHDLGTVDLEPTVFGLEPNQALLHQVVTAQLAAARSGTQSTKTRSEVRGGGAKPFRQKGTGRARQGSSRSPSMIGGGVALGPKPRSYAQRTPKKMVRQALLSALSDRAEIGRITVIDDWKIEAPKTKDAATVVRKLRLTGTVLVVLAADELDVERSFANLPAVQTTTFAELSAHDVIRADWLVFSDRTLPTGPSDFSGTHGTGSDDELDTPAPAAAPAAKKAPAEKAASPAKKAAATKKAKAAAEDAEQALEAIEAEAEIELPASDTDTDTVSDTDTEEAGTDA